MRGGNTFGVKFNYVFEAYKNKGYIENKIIMMATSPFLPYV